MVILYAFSLSKTNSAPNCGYVEGLVGQTNIFTFHCKTLARHRRPREFRRIVAVVWMAWIEAGFGPNLSGFWSKFVLDAAEGCLNLPRNLLMASKLFQDGPKIAPRGSRNSQDDQTVTQDELA